MCRSWYISSHEVLTLEGEANERWQLLCKLAAEEQDPDKLLELAAAIDRLLTEKEQRLRNRDTLKKGAA